MLSTRSPLTKMYPPSGFNSPRISRRIVDFPAPLAPRKIFVWPVFSVKLISSRITFSSNASVTLSKTTIGPPGPRASSRSAERGSRSIGHQYISTDEQLGDEKIHHEDRDRAGHHGVGRRTADALGAARRPQPDVAADLTIAKPRKNGLISPIQTSWI